MTDAQVRSQQLLSAELDALIERAMKEPGVADMLRVLEAGQDVAAIARGLPAAQIETFTYSATSNR